MSRRFLLLSLALHTAVLGWLATAAKLPSPSLPAPPLTVAMVATTPNAGNAPPRPPARHATTAGGANPSPAAASAESPARREAGRQPDPALANHLRTLVHRLIEQQFVYPPLARKYGWQGQVRVGAFLAPDGRLQTLRIVRSSGHAILDRDALATLRRIGAIPAARDLLNGAPYNIELPITYRLING